MAPVQARLTRILLIVVALVAWILTGGTPSPAGQAADAPRRIVSLVPATTEMLFAMGAGDRVVGVGSYDRYPPQIERLPRLGGLLDPNIESLIALRPDLVVLYDTQTELRRQLERAGIGMWAYRTQALADITSQMRELGRRAGVPDAADRAASAIERSLQAIRTRVAGRARPKTLLVFGRESGSLRGINASGGYGFLHDLLDVAGGADVLADINRAAVTMSTEMVLARAPEVIIELHYGDVWPPDRIESERRVWFALPSVPAVRAGRVALLVGDEFVVPGPRVTVAAEKLSRLLHPDAWR